jgi:hypothetical protein
LTRAIPGRAADPAVASITYISGATIYTDAGRDRGLRVGDVLDVIRGSDVIAQIRVQHIMSSGASCRVVSTSGSLSQGDQVRFTPHDEREGVAPLDNLPSAAAPPVRSRGWMRDHGLRGRMGLRLLVSRSTATSRRNLSQPGFDLVVTGREVAGAPIDLAVDARGRKTYHRGSPESRTRVYRLSGAWHPTNSNLHATAGRQVSSSFTPVGVFDGGSVEITGGTWGVGAFTGTQPDPESGDPSSKIFEYGLCASREDGRGGARRHSVQLGWIGSYVHGAIDREYLFLQQRYEGAVIGTSVIMETDVNRGWKAGAGERGFAVTSTYAQFHVRPSRSIELRTGLDNRRSVRLFRDRTTPETEFDDNYRQRSWIGAGLRFGSNVDLQTDVRLSGPEMSGKDRSGSIALAVSRITRLGLGLRVRSTRFESRVADGHLQSLTLSATPVSFAVLECEGGIRRERAQASYSIGRNVAWLGLDLDLNLGKRWYLILSEERTLEAGRAEDLIYLKINVRG